MCCPAVDLVLSSARGSREQHWKPQPDKANPNQVAIKATPALLSCSLPITSFSPMLELRTADPLTWARLRLDWDVFVFTPSIWPVSECQLKRAKLVWSSDPVFEGVCSVVVSLRGLQTNGRSGACYFRKPESCFCRSKMITCSIGGAAMRSRRGRYHFK